MDLRIAETAGGRIRCDAQMLHAASHHRRAGALTVLIPMRAMPSPHPSRTRSVLTGPDALYHRAAPFGQGGRR